MTEKEKELLAKVADLETRNENLELALSRRRVDDARERLGDTMDRFSYDATGQDGEREIDRAAEDYVRAQDSCLKETDPERWAEIRMGC